VINEANIKDINALRKSEIDALTERLGPVGMTEFMRQYDSGYGDYTKERHNWLDYLTVNDIIYIMKYGCVLL